MKRFYVSLFQKKRKEHDNIDSHKNHPLAGNERIIFPREGQPPSGSPRCLAVLYHIFLLFAIKIYTCEKFRRRNFKRAPSCSFLSAESPTAATVGFFRSATALSFAPFAARAPHVSNASRRGRPGRLPSPCARRAQFPAEAALTAVAVYLLFL